jgi:hypothetical protein
MSDNEDDIKVQLKVKNTNKLRRKCKYIGCKKIVINDVSFLNTKDFKICCDLHNKCLSVFEKPDECPICLEEFSKYDSVPLIPCSHWVCKKCVINSGKNECPICRQEVQLSKVELKQCNKINNKRQKEKEEQQMIEDRRIAEQLQRELNQNERRIQVQPVIVRRVLPVINVENIEEMLIVIDALEDPIEQEHLRRYFLNMLRLSDLQQEQNNLNEVNEVEDEDEDEAEVE